MADQTTLAPATHSQPSRKGKKAWRKNVDISQVTAGLDDVRDQIIQGGVLAEKDADQLFATDLVGDEEMAKKGKGKKLLKADEILAQRSAVPGLAPHKKRKVEKVEDTGPVAGTTGKKVKNGNYVSHKELQRLRGVADNAAGGVGVEEGQASHDPWAPVHVEKDPHLSFLEDTRPQPKKAPETLKHAPASLTANGKSVPNVRKPSAGKSYNPLVSDWSALLEREGAKAVEDEKARLAAEAAAADLDARAQAEAAKVEAQEKDEAATDYESAWESEWEGFQSGGEEDEVHTAKMPRRKTPAERNKVKARKEREARERWERKQKEKEAQEGRIGQIAKEMSARDKARALQKQKQKRTRAGQQPTPAESSASEPEAEDVDPQLQRRRFGQLPIPEAPLEVVLPDELQDSLRRLKPEGDLLKDRYRNLLVNGKLEVRRKRDREQWAKPKRETTEKWSYKDWQLK